MKKFIVIIFVLSITSLSKTVKATEYNLLKDDEYYIDVNKEKNVPNNNYDKIKKQITNQYQGPRDFKKTRYEFDMSEYGYYFDATFSFGKLKDVKADTEISGVSSKSKIDFGDEFSLPVSFGLFWYGGLRLDLEYVGKNNDIKIDDIKNKLKFKKLFFNITYEDYKYECKFSPFITLGIGGIQAKLEGKNIDSEKDTVPALQGKIGMSYAINNDFSFFLQYKYDKSLKDMEIKEKNSLTTIAVPYDNQAIEFGFRLFLK